MGYMRYSQVGRRSCHGRRCFKLNLRRFSVQRLRRKLLSFFRLVGRWQSSCGHMIESIKKGVIARSCGSGGRRKRRRRNLVVPNVSTRADDYILRSFARSNSFYSEAIEDCLEFIKRSSISVDEYKPITQV